MALAAVASKEGAGFRQREPLVTIKAHRDAHLIFPTRKPYESF